MFKKSAKMEDAERELCGKQKVATETEENDIFESETVTSGPSSDEASEASFDSPDEDSLNDNNFRNIALKGKIWTKYRPIKQYSIYSRILSKTEDISTIVQELCTLFYENSRDAAASLLQFCIDVCGCQRFDISDAYITERNVRNTLIKFIQVLSNDAKYVEAAWNTTERYLLMEDSRLAKSLQWQIYIFLQDFMEMAHTNGLLDQEGSITDFFKFLRYMMCDKLRVFCHTGTIFCAKIITALVKIHMTGNHKNTITFDLMQLLYFTFIENINFDKKLDNARLECCREICIWAKVMPKEFIGDWDILHYVMKLIHDPANKVRLMILRVVQKLLKNREIFQVLRQNVEDRMRQLIVCVSQRFSDIDEKVAVEAVRIFSILQEVAGRRYLNTDLVEEITEIIFENHFIIAQAACDFIYKYLSKSEEGACGNVLNSMTVITQRYPYGPQLLVEGCLQVMPEIRDWALYIRILSEKKENFRLQNIATVFSEAVSQVLKGCSSNLRNGSPLVNADPAEHNRIAQHFPQLINLIFEFRDTRSIQEEIFKIFTIAKPTSDHTEDYIRLCILIEQLFTEDLSKQLLSQILLTLNNLCDNAHFGDRAKVVERSVVDNCSEQFKMFLKKSLEMESSPIIVYKAMVLYENGKFTNKIPWSLLFHALPNFELEVLTDLLICCKWHLIWTLRELIKETKSDRSRVYQDNLDLINEIKSYTTLLFQVLTDLEVHTLRVKVYNCTCEFYTCWNDMVKYMISSDKRFEELLLIREPKITNVIVPFLEESIIKNAEMPLKERKNGIVAFIEMVQNGTTPLSNLIHVYKYYDQYLPEYGKIIELSMKFIGGRDTKRYDLNAIIIGTIANVHDAIINKYGVIDKNIHEVKALKILIKRFLTTEQFRKSNNDFLTLVTMAIEYSVNASKMSYLFFAQHYLTLITIPSDFDYILGILRRQLTEEQKKSNAVLCFIEIIKRLKGSKTTSVQNSAKVQGNRQLSDNTFASPGRPNKESTPKRPDGSKKRKSGASTSSGTVPQGTTLKGIPKVKKTAGTSRPVYSKSSEGVIDIQDDSD